MKGEGEREGGVRMRAASQHPPSNALSSSPSIRVIRVIRECILFVKGGEGVS